MRIALQPIFPDFPFEEHFTRLSTVENETRSALGSSWDLYLDGMQLLYDIYAAAGTRLAIPDRDRKEAALMTSTQAVSALTSAGVLLLQGDAARSIVCSRQGFEEFLHYFACLNVVGVARRYLDGKTPRAGEIRTAIQAKPMVSKTYSWLSRPAHGGIENVELMHRDGWLPLQTGKASLDGAHIAAVTAIHVVAIGLPLIAGGFGPPEEAWYRLWLERHAAFMSAWRQEISKWLPELASASGLTGSESP